MCPFYILSDKKTEDQKLKMKNVENCSIKFVHIKNSVIQDVVLVLGSSVFQSIWIV